VPDHVGARLGDREPEVVDQRGRQREGLAERAEQVADQRDVLRPRGNGDADV
jgi:hypothetical protein